MKKRIFALLIASALPVMVGAEPPPRAIAPIPAAPLPQTAPAPAQFGRFDLDFPGGKPQDLINAIEKSSGKHLNAIIPDEFSDIQLPPMKMKEVNVRDLFKAMYRASVSRGETPGGSSREVSYGFFNDGQDETGVWYFQANGIEAISKPSTSVCRFFQLGPYLPKYSVEDITTAIKTGWQMQNITNPPSMKYHKETALLIVVGNPEQIENVYDVLRTLQAPHADPPPPKPSR